MNVVTYPKAYQSAFREACFVLDGIYTTPDGLDVGIYAAADSTMLGVKRIYGSGQVAVNAAPYVRGLLAPGPLCARESGMATDPNRAVACSLKAEDYASAAVYLTGGTEDPPINTILSAFSGCAQIRPGEKDELSVITGGGFVRPMITFMYEGTEYVYGSFEALSVTSMVTFVVDADAIGRYFSELTGVNESEMTEFTVRLRMTVDSSEVCVSRRYHIDRNSSGGRRLAWVNSYGAVDYYTFPYCTGEKSSGSRERIYTSDGYRTVATTEVKLQMLLSAQLDDGTAEWLSEIFSSPRAWSVEGDNFQQVEVESGSAGYSTRRPGAVSVSVAPAKKTVSRKY